MLDLQYFLFKGTYFSEEPHALVSGPRSSIIEPLWYIRRFIISLLCHIALGFSCLVKHTHTRTHVYCTDPPQLNLNPLPFVGFIHTIFRASVGCTKNVCDICAKQSNFSVKYIQTITRARLCCNNLTSQRLYLTSYKINNQ